MNSLDAEKWKRTRSRGMLRFLLVAGVARAGAAFFVVFSGLDYVTRYGLVYNTALASNFAAWIPGSLVVGAVYGLFYWLIMEKQYKNLNHSK